MKIVDLAMDRSKAGMAPIIDEIDTLLDRLVDLRAIASIEGCAGARAERANHSDRANRADRARTS